MKTTLRYIFVLLLVVISSTKAIYVFYLDSAQMRCKSEAKAVVKADANLTVIKISTQEFRAAHVDDNEIKLNGSLYDIKHCETDHDSVIVYLFHDTNEEEILDAFTALFQTYDSPATDGSRMSKFHPTGLSDWKVVSSGFELRYNSSYAVRSLNYSETEISHYASISFPIIAPPPQSGILC